MRALATALPGITRRVLGRRGFNEAGLIADWPAIVGRDIARICLPSKFSRPRKTGGPGTLTVRVDAAAALEIQHLEPMLVERINGYFGYRAVARLRLLQTPTTTPSDQKPGENRPRSSVSPEFREQQESPLDSIADADLRAALGRLRRAVRDRRD